MLQRVYSMLGPHSSSTSSSNYLGFTVVNPLAAGHNADVGAQLVSRVPEPLDPEDYEVRFTVDLAQQILQPLNVVGVKDADNARLQVFLMPEPGNHDTPQKPEKVYEAPAHSPTEPLPYRVSREYLFCLKFKSNTAVGIMSVKMASQEVETREFGALPYFCVKWLQREGRRSQ